MKYDRNIYDMILETFEQPPYLDSISDHDRFSGAATVYELAFVIDGIRCVDIDVHDGQFVNLYIYTLNWLRGDMSREIQLKRQLPEWVVKVILITEEFEVGRIGVIFDLIDTPRKPPKQMDRDKFIKLVTAIANITK